MPLKVLICGGGIAGLGLAWCLQRRGHQAVIVEKSPRLRGEGYMIDFFGPGYDAAERLGLLPDLTSIHRPVERLVFVNRRGDERFALPYARIRQRLFLGRHFNFLRGDLEGVLYARVGDALPVRFATTVRVLAQEPDHVRALLSDGTTFEADVVVGADGVHSSVRQLLFGPTDFERPLGFRTAAFILDRVPRGLSLLNDFVTLNAPSRQVAVYPIGGGRLATFFIHRSDHEAPAPGPAGPLEELRAVYGDLGWIVPELLDHCPTDAGLYLDSVSQVELPVWSQGRVTLAGDACQCVSLLAGQGASLALAGACLLANELDANAQDVGRALTGYEGRLKPVVARKQAAGRRLARWFVPRTGAQLWLRDVMLRTSTSAAIAPFVRGGLAGGGIDLGPTDAVRA